MFLQIVLFAFTLYAILALILRHKAKQLPPGPAPWPLFGNVPDFMLAKFNGVNSVDLLTQWKKQYGNVFTIWLGPMPAVNVCEYKTAMDAFVKTADAHTGRSRNLMQEVTRGNKGLLFSDGDQWHEQRRFSLHVLRNFGVGRNLMQERILEEVDYNFNILDKRIDASTSGKIVFSPPDLFDPLVGSIINMMIAGFRFDETNMDSFFALKHDLDRSINEISVLDAALLKKQTMHLPIFKQRLEKLMRPSLNIQAILQKIIDDRKARIADGSYILVDEDPSDYIDAYLSEMKKREEFGHLGSFSEQALVLNLLDLWIAGMETTILTLSWAIIYILNNPQVQEKCRNEILQCTGGNRNIELADKKELTYLSATITEVQRHASILNFNLWHKTTTKTVVGDYVIPEGITIAPQLSVIMSDEQQFQNPTKFDPDRFIGTKLDQQVIPFSIGKRSCLGEGLAKAELFLILGNLLQRYKVSVPEGESPPSTEPLNPFGVFHRIRPYTAVFEKLS